jgi:hypothetical protein
MQRAASTRLVIRKSKLLQKNIKDISFKREGYIPGGCALETTDIGHGYYQQTVVFSDLHPNDFIARRTAIRCFYNILRQVFKIFRTCQRQEL